MTIYSDSLTSNIATTKTNIATTGTDINKLNTIQRPNYNAMQLHQRRNAMLNRVQRIEDRRLCQWAQKQKPIAATKLTDFQRKLLAYESQLADYEKTLLPPPKDLLVPTNDLLVLQPMLPVLAEPMTSPLLFPKVTKIRTQTKRRLGQSRYGY